MNQAVYKYLWSTFGQQPGYWVGFGAGLAQSITGRIGLAIFQASIVAAVARGDAAGARRWILWYLAVGIIGLFLRFLRDAVGNLAENKVYTRLMVTYYERLVAKDLSFYRDHQTGYLAGAYRQHLDSAMNFVRLFRGEIQQTVVLLVMPMAVLLVLAWPVGLTVLAVVLIQIVYVLWASKLTQPYRSITHEVYRRVSGLVADDVTNIVAFKSSGAAQQSRDRMTALAQEEKAAYTQRRLLLARLETPRDAITFIGASIALWLAVQSGSDGLGSVGLLVLVIVYMVQIYNAVQGIPSVVEQHDDLVSKLYPTLEYMTHKFEDVHDDAHPVALPRSGGAIVFERVNFAYRTPAGQRVPVFKDLNLIVAAGEQVGIVGLSGAGKSTLASLLMRFDDIDSGSIEVDGVDIRKVAQIDLRQRMAYVPQEPLLFHRSIRENIVYFRPGATQNDIEKAAKAAHASEFIARLPDGYETLVGERGVKLSGGQKQRIVLARSILKDAEIMIFDEATSALDSVSERIIQASLPGIIGKRTAIVIAHRLSTVADLDRIVVMREGRIAEQGTHEQLLAKRGQYFELWQKQSRLTSD